MKLPTHDIVVSANLMKRLILRIDTSSRDGCWPWIGSTSAGYGQIYSGIPGTLYRAHRVMKIFLHGSPPDNDLVIDHLCHNRACCNPSHMEWVTSGVNTLRGFSPNMVAHAHATCLKGHDISGDNGSVRRRGPRSSRLRIICMTCRREWERGRARLSGRPGLPRVKLSDADVRQIRNLRLDGVTLAGIGRSFGLTASSISEICARKTYAYVSD